MVTRFHRQSTSDTKQKVEDHSGHHSVEYKDDLHSSLPKDCKTYMFILNSS